MRPVSKVKFGHKRVWVPRHKKTIYKLIFNFFIVPNIEFRQFQDGLVWVSIVARKMLDLRLVLEDHCGQKGFGYLATREPPINLYSVLSWYCNTKYLICGHFEIVWFGFHSWYVKG